MDVLDERGSFRVGHGLSLGRRQIIRSEIYHQKIDLGPIQPDPERLDCVALACALPSHFPPVAFGSLYHFSPRNKPVSWHPISLRSANEGRIDLSLGRDQHFRGRGEPAR